MASIGLFFTALRFLPLADAVAISFVMPFILLLLGRLVLGEEIGTPAGRRLRRRLPRHDDGGSAELRRGRRSGAAAAGGGAHLRALHAGDPADRPRGRPAAAAGDERRPSPPLVLLPLVLVADGRGWPGLDPVWPPGRNGRSSPLLGLIGTLAHLLVTWSLRFAPSATLAPMQYLEIPFATLVGFLLFGDLPDGLATAGIAVTVAAGLYVIHRERRATLRAAVGLPA